MREWRLPGLLYADDLVLYGQSEEDLRAMLRGFDEVLIDCFVEEYHAAWKSRKSRKEEKVVGFSSASLFPARKR